MSDILYEQRDGLGVITLNRPGKLNAFDTGMARQLQHALITLTERDDLRAILIRAEGHYFSAGGDLGFFRETLAADHDAAQQAFADLVEAVHAVIGLLTALPVPVVAAVQGGAAGFGISLLAACDFVVAERGSGFNAAYVNLGASPDGGISWMLPRLLGLRAARRLLMLGETLDAVTAQELGLIDLIAEPGELSATAEALAGRLAAGPTLAYGRIKGLLADSARNSLAEQLDAEKQGFLASAATRDFQEGLSAFLSRRPPQYTGH
ncbi:MAG TPA: enoyl-CoA hydratase-related protein [Fluviicoccus sp.]|nr:enoyl-CoA hydratase-related protein [Fluviicoccus sp.]